jgi:hypothetical protein
MKGGLAAAMIAATAIKRSGARLGGRLWSEPSSTRRATCSASATS